MPDRGEPRTTEMRVAGLTISTTESNNLPALTNPDLVLTVRRGCLAAEATAPLFDSGGVWKLFDSDGRKRFEFHAPTLGPRPYKVATIEADWSRGEVVLDDEYVPGDSLPLEYPLDELLFVHLLARHGGVEVHASAIAIDDEGYLFVGHSGAGKSTIAKLWLEHEPSARALSDDRIVLRRGDDGQLRMWGTPWHGTARFASPGGASIRGIHILCQAPDTTVRRIEGRAAVAELLSRSFYPVYDQDAVRKAADSIADVVELVPVYELRFRLNRDVLEVVRSC